MTATTAAKLRGLVVVVIVGAWALIAHHGSAGGGNADLNAAVGVTPVVVFFLVLLSRTPSLPLRIAGALAGLALLVGLWPHARQNVPLLYYLQHLGAHLALGTFFGRSLIGPGEALITRIARSIYNGTISARKVRYTRQVTLVWTVFFFGNALLSTGLFLFAPPEIWSMHANLLTWPLVGLLFAAEHLWRMHALPPEERPGLVDIIRSFRRHSRRQDPAAPRS
ncbi:MAG: hypothetical protein IPL58_07655 [Betaproteobacteria bacterium]|jgi:uncharacterized membrane protein|uniref:Transmembrane protein n=1 Tax=Candidatus Proximibacter danicus TaxID=2954365 RepID=A0A9D7K041_9PROT|nr:hypothetical protein [Candidatus Proximibacter danicus]MBK9447538.1 hypothetical protein [Betaproteobacteria bacterium]